VSKGLKFKKSDRFARITKYPLSQGHGGLVLTVGLDFCRICELPVLCQYKWDFGGPGMALKPGMESTDDPGRKLEHPEKIFLPLLEKLIPETHIWDQASQIIEDKFWRSTMSLIRYEPFTMLDRLHLELNRLGASDRLKGDLENEDKSNVITSHWRPAVDIREEDNRFVILADIPGVNPEDIEITMEDSVLTIKGERTYATEEEREGYKRSERTQGTFYRRFSLPDTTDADKIEASGKNGVLEIVLPKQEKVQPRKISVKH